MPKEKTEVDIKTSLPVAIQTGSTRIGEELQDAKEYVQRKVTSFGKIIDAATEYASTDLALPPGSKEREIFEEVF